MLKRPWWYVAGGLLILTVLFGVQAVRRYAIYDRTYRIGFESEPPFHFRDKQGRPAGLAIDILNEAARRTGIRLQWAFEASSSEMGLRNGRVDLWPIMTIRPERKAYLHFTDPYRESESCYLVRAESPFRKPTDLDGASIGYNGLPLTKQMMAVTIPTARLFILDDTRQLIEKVCRGEADATYMDEFTVISALMNGVDCGGTALRAIPLPDSRGQLGIGSTFASAGAADVLRAAISDMSEDGTLSELIGRWAYFTGRSMEQSSALVQARRRERIMTVATSGALLLLVLTVWLAWRIRHQSNRARRAEGQRAELAEQLQQAQRMESIGRLAGGVAHDFNNLLTVINGYAELLQTDDQMSTEQRAHAFQIAEAGGQAANLTQQLLAFSRKQVIQPVPLNLNAVVQGITTMLRRLVGEDIELVTVLEPGLAPVMADSSQLHQVIMNLAVNSRDAMPAGGQLRIETTNTVIDARDAAANPDAVAGTYVLLSVSDTGSGMDRETLRHVFEPFFTTKGKGEGTGLGLSMVYGIVKQSRGWVAITSAPGQGTTFNVYLPQVAAAANAHDPHGSNTDRATGSETILLVEDQPSVRQLASSVLLGCGYHLLEAESGEAALGVAADYPGTIDLLLTDVVLPGMTGKDLAELLRATRPDMRVLFASGYAENVIVHRGVVTPGLRYLPKPYAPHVLAQKVRETLDHPDPASVSV